MMVLPGLLIQERHHMTWSLEILNDSRKITTCQVGMPNGHRVLAIDEGSIALDDNLIFLCALFILQFDFYVTNY